MFLVFGLSKVIDQIGQMKDLDSISKPLSDVVSKVTAPDAVKNALSGTWLGHQLHPMLTDLPIGAWSMASALDLTSRGTMPKVSERLVGLGILTAVPAALSGASDWSESYGKEQRLGLLHALGNSVGTTLQVASWISRRCGHHRTGTGLSLAGLAATMGASYLGGHLSFGMGVGVDHTAFQKTITKWVDVAAENEVTEGQLLRVEANDVPVMLTRHKGQLRALSATCLHAGGPLNKGHIENDCVVCPWHGSRFRLTDGTPKRGPAAMPQPTWDINIVDGRVQVRSAA